MIAILDAAWLVKTAILLPPLLLSLTVHEFAHARTALAFGDPTARDMGRVTLNPLAHLDPIGTLALIFTNLIGWAKPVPVNPANIHPLRLGQIMVSLAGPMSNLAMAVVAGLCYRAMPLEIGDNAVLLALDTMLFTAILINLGLFAFNLLPLFPLDGHHIVRELLPARLQGPFMRLQIQYGCKILLALIFLPPLLEVVLHQNVPDPICMLTGYVKRLAMEYLLAW